MVFRDKSIPAAYCAISANRTGCPASATMVATRGSWTDSIWSRRACKNFARSRLGRSAQTPASNVRRAPAMARPTSSRRVAPSSVTVDSSAGFTIGKGSSPSTHLPATNDRRSPRIGPAVTAPCTHLGGRAWFYLSRVLSSSQAISMATVGGPEFAAPRGLSRLERPPRLRPSRPAQTRSELTLSDLTHQDHRIRRQRLLYRTTTDAPRSQGGATTYRR